MGLTVVGSRAVAKKNRIYHKDGCMYAKRIKYDHVMRIPLENAVDKGYCMCKYCAGLKGDVRVQKKSLERRNKKNSMQFHYDQATDTLFVATNIGFWKIYWKEEIQSYLLYHRNEYNKNISLETAMYGDFHRQGDVRPTDMLNSLLDYIHAHDTSKVIIADDYRKLPQKTKKQKKYYKCAERKARRKQAFRLDMIFASLEKANAGFRELSFC